MAGFQEGDATVAESVGDLMADELGAIEERDRHDPGSTPIFDALARASTLWNQPELAHADDSADRQEPATLPRPAVPTGTGRHRALRAVTPHGVAIPHSAGRS